MPPPAEGLASRLVLGPALRTQPDRRLVSLVREGYELAFEEIVRRYRKPLGSYAAAIVGGRSEDVTQEAFSKALLALRRDDREIELRPWLYRIVRNAALNDLRDRPPAAEELAEAIAGGHSPEEAAEQREELSELIKHLQALPEPQRAAIVMRELEGLSHEEIAAALGLSGGAARQAIYRARQSLRDGLGMLVPLPLLKAMMAAAATGGASEAAAGAAGIGGAAGASVAIKATAATVLVAGAVGTGVAIERSPKGADVEAPVSARAAEPPKGSPEPSGGEPGSAAPSSSSGSGGPEAGGGGKGSDGHEGSGPGRSGENEPGDDRQEPDSSGPGNGEVDSHSDPGRFESESGGSNSGPGGGGDDAEAEESSSGPGSGDVEVDLGEGDGSSGSGESGSGEDSSGSGSAEDSSGSGSSDDDADGSSLGTSGS